MNFLLFAILFCLASSVAYSQSVEVTATTNPAKVNAILKQERQKSEANRAYFAEDEKCRGLIRSHDWVNAEASCRTAILLVEKLPKEHILERSSARKALGVVQIWQRKPREAIVLFEKSLEIGKQVLDDSDAETGEIYFLKAQAYHRSKDVSMARSFYEKAEKTYRTAFIEIGDDEFRFPYGRAIRNIVEAHYLLLGSAGLAEEAEKLKTRLSQVEKDFAKYLVK